MKSFYSILGSFVIFLVFSFYCPVSRSQTNTNIGNEFWIAFPPNIGTTAIIQLYISSSVATSGTIESSFPGVTQNFTVTPGIVTAITLPSLVVVQGGVEDKGIHITANDPIAVYGLNNQNASTDAFLALPVNALGLDYRVMAYPVAFGGNGSCLTAVAVQDGTNLVIFNHQTSSTINVTLNKGQTYYLEVVNMLEDITGSRVQSNFPVAVFGSCELTQVPTGCIAGDHVVEQMYPVDAWGKNFVTVPLAGRDNSGDIFRVLAKEDGTDVGINGTLVATINAGDYYEANLAGYNTIETSKATMVSQNAKGQQCSGNITGDPFMMLLFPKEQFLTSYTIINVMGVTPFNSHWVNLVAPDNALGTIYEDGVLIPNGAFVQIGTTNYYGAQRAVSQGSHVYTSTVPFGVSVYGWRNVDSYGYPGGGSMSPVGTVDRITLSPDTLYGDLNVTNVCLTAHVLDDLSNPVEGVLVNFFVSGINPLTGFGYTDASGDVQYCYTQTGTVSGTDHVYAEVSGINSDTSVVFWTYHCSDPTDGGTVGADQSDCGGFVPAQITNLVLPTGHDGTLEYKWQQSVISGVSGFADIPSSNAPDYSPGFITQTTWFRRVARVACKPDWATAALSNAVQMTVVQPLSVSVTISCTANPFCEGTAVTFTAVPVNGGLSPVYQWQVNGINAGINNPIFTYIPASLDLVSCILTSGEVCTVNNPDTSAPILMTGIPALPAGVTVTASPSPSCDGVPVTFTATPANGGPNPSYQWRVNGLNVGTNTPIYTYVPAYMDVVSCIMTSNQACVINNPDTSAPYAVSINPVPAVTFTKCFDTVTYLNAQSIKLKGGIPLGGIYSGPGVNPATGVFTPPAAGTGTKTITYSYTTAAGCSDSKTRTITVRAAPAFTCGNNLADPRDGRTYPTILIGGQCWMAADLNYGTEIPPTIHQRDNCIPEKYKSAVGSSQSSVYQWDELMRYDPAPGIQGLCPPAWHVPTEAEWNTLFMNWISNGFAGSPLKYSGYSGFNAFLSGARHENVQWDFQGFATLFWSSNPHGPYKAWAHGMNDINPSVSYYPSLRSNAFSVRCIKD